VNAKQSAALKEGGFDLPPGEYLALLSHSGSRGTGAQVCQNYSRIAMNCRYGLPKELKHLAGLTFEEVAGQAYWAAMKLMGRYAAGVELLSADIDELPRVYKDNQSVMAAQTDLVDVLGEFRPRIVKMYPEGAAED
jgi:RNA-splicing ligase RtcB